MSTCLRRTQSSILPSVIPRSAKSSARNSRSSISADRAATSSAICHPMTASVRCQAAM